MILDIIKTNAATMYVIKKYLFAPKVLIYKYEQNVQENFYYLLRRELRNFQMNQIKLFHFV